MSPNDVPLNNTYHSALSLEQKHKLSSKNVKQTRHGQNFYCTITVHHFSYRPGLGTKGGRGYSPPDPTLINLMGKLFIKTSSRNG